MPIVVSPSGTMSATWWRTRRRAAPMPLTIESASNGEREICKFAACGKFAVLRHFVLLCQSAFADIARSPPRRRARAFSDIVCGGLAVAPDAMSASCWERCKVADRGGVAGCVARTAGTAVSAPEYTAMWQDRARYSFIARNMLSRVMFAMDATRSSGAQHRSTKAGTEHANAPVSRQPLRRCWRKCVPVEAATCRQVGCDHDEGFTPRVDLLSSAA